MEKIPLPGKKTDAPNRKARKPSKYMELLTAVGLATGISPAIHSALREQKPDQNDQKPKRVLRAEAPKTQQPKIVYTPPEAPSEQKAQIEKPVDAPLQAQIEVKTNTEAKQMPAYESASIKLQAVLRDHTPLEQVAVDCKDLDPRDKIKVIEDLMRAYADRPPKDENKRERMDDARFMQLEGGYWTDNDNQYRYHLGAPGLIADLMSDDTARQYVMNRLTIGAGDEMTENLKQGIKYKFQVDVGTIEKAIENDEALSAISPEQKQSMIEELKVKRTRLSELGMQAFKLGGVDRNIKRLEASLK